MKEFKNTNDHIPESEAKRISHEYGFPQVVIVAFDPVTGNQHVTTFGTSAENSDAAAQFGNFIKRSNGWPVDMCIAEPEKVLKLRDRIVELENKVSEVDVRYRQLSSTNKKLEGELDEFKAVTQLDKRR